MSLSPPERLAGPDAAEVVIATLNANLSPLEGMTVPPRAHRTVPDPRPAAFVVVGLLGGSGRSEGNPVTDRQALTVECWADRVADAADLARDARGIVHASRGVVLGGAQIYRVEEFGAPVDLPDSLSSQHRAVFQVQLTVRLRRLAS